MLLPHPFPVPDAALPDAVPLAALGVALSELLRRPVAEAELRERAVTLGLMRLPAPDEAPVLTAETASRLLLAAYRLPGHVTPGRPQDLLRARTAGLFAHLLGTPGESCPEPVCLLLIAAPDWSALPTTPGPFFAGTRERDGSLYWDAAEGATDGRGHVLRL